MVSGDPLLPSQRPRPPAERLGTERPVGDPVYRVRSHGKGAPTTVTRVPGPVNQKDPSKTNKLKKEVGGWALSVTLK